MSEPTQNCLSATASTGSNPPSSSSPPQIPDLEAMRQRWDKKLEEDFAEIKEILRPSLLRLSHQSTERAMWLGSLWLHTLLKLLELGPILKEVLLGLLEGREISVLSAQLEGIWE
uniref:Uncharacterized protein n=1 Tax=Talaromyces marneffei PM1 TaxID=1077442 RepID=A0A093V6J9_TALMA